MMQFTVSPETSSKLLGALLTLIVMGVGYIARTAHNISEQVGKLSRVLFGEDGQGGLYATVADNTKHLTRLDQRVAKIESKLDIDDRKEPA